MEVLSIIMYGICIEMCANGCHIPHYISLHLERSEDLLGHNPQLIGMGAPALSQTGGGKLAKMDLR